MTANISVPTLSEKAEGKLKQYVQRYPESKSAVMPALYIAQEELGYISKEAVYWVADRLNLPPAHVFQVATFYTMYYKNPVGTYHFQVCRTLSCAIRGAGKLTECLHKRLGVKPHEITKDGMFSYEEVECLGSCGTAPMIELNDTYFENLNPEKLNALIDRLEREKPRLRYSAVTEELGDGFSDLPKSEVWVKS